MLQQTQKLKKKHHQTSTEQDNNSTVRAGHLLGTLVGKKKRTDACEIRQESRNYLGKEQRRHGQWKDIVGKVSEGGNDPHPGSAH